MPADTRREQTLRRIASVFARKGFGSTTAELARASGVSEGMLFKIFGDKHGMYAALIERKIARSGDTVFPRVAAEARNDTLVFSTIAGMLLRQMEEDPTFLRLLLYSALEGNELSTMFHEVRVRKILAFVAGYIRRRISDGAFRPVDPELAALGFLGMVGQYAMAVQVFRVRPSRVTRAEKVVETFVDMTLHGIRR